jgi:hypothetical protein
MPQQSNPTMIPSEERVEINLNKKLKMIQMMIQITSHLMKKMYQTQVDEQRYPTRAKRGRHTAFLGFLPYIHLLKRLFTHTRTKAKPQS